MSGEEGIVRKADPSPYTLCVSYTSSRFRGPSHAVGFRSNVTGWEADMAMREDRAAGASSWAIRLESGDEEGPVQYEFKLVLDDEHWQAGWNNVARTTAPPTHITFDDRDLSWEGMTSGQEPGTGHEAPAREGGDMENAVVPVLIVGAIAAVRPVRERAVAVGRASGHFATALAAVTVAGAREVARAAVTGNGHRHGGSAPAGN